ncbi:MAG: YqjD family protein [Stellaceae bacterium]
MSDTSISRGKANGGKPDLTAIRDDLDALKTDLGALLKYAKNGAVDDVSDEAKRLYGKLSAQSGELYGKLSAQSGETLETVTRQIEENPLASLLIAFGVGFIFARILSR